DNDIIDAQILQHSTADFTGKCTFIFEMQVLSTNFDFRSFSRFDQSWQIRKRSANYALNAVYLRFAFHRFEESFCFRNGFEHLPVPCNDRCSHAVHSLSFTDSVTCRSEPQRLEAPCLP